MMQRTSFRPSVFTIAIVISVALHAIPLSVHFTMPDASKNLQNKALEIVLVNSSTKQKPNKPQVLAQANLDGGGKSDEDKKAKTPLPAFAKEQKGSELEKLQKEAESLKAEQQRLLAQTQRKKNDLPHQNKTPTRPSNTLTGSQMAAQALEMTRLQGIIDQQQEEQNKRPALKTIGVSALRSEEAAYLHAWERKIERIGTLNYPSEAKGRLYGVVTVWVRLKKDGSLYEVSVERSSGQPVLDKAAIRIVEMGAPYAEIPQNVLGQGDHLGFARRLNFTNTDTLKAK